MGFAASSMLLFFLGVASGICSSAPIGPANLWIASATIPPIKPIKNIVFFSFGIICVDLLYAFIAFWGYFSYIKNSSLSSWVGVAGGIGLVVLGFVETRSAKTSVDLDVGKNIGKQSSNARGLRDFFVGSFICGSNPAFILFWVFVASQVGKLNIDSLTPASMTLILLGVAVGDLFWYSFFYLAAKKGMSLLSEKLIYYMRVSIGVCLILFGFVTAGSFVWGAGFGFAL